MTRPAIRTLAALASLALAAILLTRPPVLGQDLIGIGLLLAGIALLGESRWAR